MTRRCIALLIAVAVPFLWLAVVRVNALAPGGEVSVDSYYHVFMADRFPGPCVARTFPWTTMSLWKDQFYDKELLFHAVLSGVRTVGGVLGVSPGPPFHFPALAFGLAVIAAFALVASALRIPGAWGLTAAFVALSPVFTQRLLMLRPHLLSLILMLLFCWHLTRVRRPWWSLLFGFAASYAYSNPHLLLVPAIAFTLVAWRKDRRLAALVPLSTLAGLAAGLTLHPQFPNTFRLWKVQSIDVVLQMLSGTAPVSLGSELLPPPLAWYRLNAAFFVCVALNLAALAWLRRREPRPAMPFDTSLVLTLHAITAVGSLVSQRTFEYGWPFALLATGLLLRDMKAAGLGGGLPPWIRRSTVPAVGAAVLAAFLVAGTLMVRWVAPNQAREMRGFGAWAARLAPGTVVANVDWSDFPRLLYAAPQCRYLWGIEPMFSYAARPAQVARLEAFRWFEISLSPRELRELTGAMFVFVGRPSAALAMEMFDSRYAVAYQGAEGWVFDVRAAR